jgi:hypothetical protein
VANGDGQLRQAGPAKRTVADSGERLRVVHRWSTAHAERRESDALRASLVAERYAQPHLLDRARPEVIGTK